MIETVENRLEANLKSGTVESWALLPRGWYYAPLGALCSMIAGGTPRSGNDAYWGENDDPQNTPWISISDMSQVDLVTSTEKSVTPIGLNSSRLHRGESGTILFAMYASVGEVSMTGLPAVWNQALLGLTPLDSERLHSRFLFYALKTLKPYLPVYFRSNTQHNLNAGTVARLRIPLPPPETQQRIADYLDRETAEIDAAVADLDKYVELLEKRIRTVVHHSVFGSSISESRKLLHPVIGSIPSSWDTSKFSIEFRESNNLNGLEPVGDLLSISEFHGVIVNNRGKEGQQSSEDISNYRVVRPNQLAANMMWLDHGGLGVSSLRGYISPDYRAFDISNRLLPAYTHYLLRSKSYVDYFSTISVGVRPNAKRTTKVTLGMTPIPVPPLEVQSSIVSSLENELMEIEDIIADAIKLRDLLRMRRSVLIADVVTGRKQV